MVAQTQK